MAIRCAVYPYATMTTTGQAPESLIAALTKARIPAENHEFIRRVTAAVGITEYRAVVRPDKSHVIAARRDGLADLHIYYGYTTGFTSKAEILRVAGSGAGCAPSSRRGTWYVEHPTNKVRPGTSGVHRGQRDAGFCSCGMQLPLTGVCAYCD